jgi:predicted outer membrane protein
MRIPKLQYVVVGCALFLGATTAQAQQKKGTQARVDPGVEKVLRNLHETNLAQIEVGRMAQEKATNDDVRSLGQEMVDQHRQFDRQIQDIAKKKGVTVDTGKSATQVEIFKRSYSKLGEAQGEQFDRQFLTAMLEGQSEIIKDIARMPMDTKDAEVEGMIQDELPKLHDQYEQASTTLAKIGTEGYQREQQQQQQR